MTPQTYELLVVLLNLVTLGFVGLLVYLAKRQVSRIDELDHKIGKMCASVGVLDESKRAHEARLSTIEARCWECFTKVLQQKRELQP